MLLMFITGALLPEMVTCMVLLQLHTPAVLQSCKAISVLEGLLDILDKFNRLAPGLDREDKEDLAWPGVWSKSASICHCYSLSSKFRLLCQ